MKPTQTVGWQDGSWRPMPHIAIPVNDLGCLQGVVVVDRLRTVQARVLDGEAHVLRWQSGCRELGIDIDRRAFGLEQLSELVELNRCQFPSDFGIVLLATPGSGDGVPTVIAHPAPIAWQSLQRCYAVGQPLMVAKQHLVPDQCWPLNVKNRARINYFLADQAARMQSSDATAAGVLKYRTPRDEPSQRNASSGAADIAEGEWIECLADTSSANLLIIEPMGGRVAAANDDALRLVTPPAEHCFRGLSLQRTLRLATELGIDVLQEPISIARAKRASGLLLTGTTGCIWRANRLDETRWHELGAGAARMYEQLCEAWQRDIELDFREQAEQLQ